MIPMTRRRFNTLAAALPLAGAISASVSASAQEPDAGAGRRAGPFGFLALGDVHFDRPEQHDLDWLRRDHPNDVRQVEDYSRITREVLPGLLQELRQSAARPDSPAPVRFVAQLGDFIEGMCGAPALAQKQCEEAVALIRGAELGVPFYEAKGNHEIQGPGAADAFDRILLPVVGGPEVHDRGPGPASFTIAEGDCLFVFFDAYDRDGLRWLERTVSARSARHLFVLLHPPVVPFGARSLWHLYARPSQEAPRRRLLNLLGEHRAIVLSAHLHKYGVVVRETDSGRFLQLALCSVLPARDVRARDVVEGVDRYGPDLVRLEPHFSPETEPERRAALRAEAPFIKYYEYGDAPGYALVTVEGDRVRADVHVGLGRPPWRRLDLTALLAGG